MQKFLSLSLIFILILSGCSSAYKARNEERERVSRSKGVYCDFVSESDFKDVDVELNIRMAKKCNAEKPFSLSAYKRVSENPGVLYCCNTEKPEESESNSSKAPTSSPSSKKAE